MAEVNKSIDNDFKDFNIYSTLFHDLFFNFLEISVTLLLCVGIIDLTKKYTNPEKIHPVDLHNKFYGDGTCDLGKMKSGETSFCDGYHVDDTAGSEGSSVFATKLSTYAKNMGYITADSFSLLILWFSYLAFSCEHFVNTLLNMAHSLALTIFTGHIVKQGFFIIIILSLVSRLNIKYITPFLTDVFKIVKNKDKNNIFLELTNTLIINFLCIMTLLFIFIMVPLTIYYIFAICKILSENLSIQMNVLTLFSLFLTLKSLALFMDFMDSQFGKAAIENQTRGKKNKAQAIARAGIQDKVKFKAFITSYSLFFIIPIIVGLVKLYKLIILLFSNIDVMNVETKYKLMFIAIILFNFYYPIKEILDEEFNFPYSIIYIVVCVILFGMIVYKNKQQLK
jgi:hypothetical protein